MIYLDNAATTKPSSEVLENATKYYLENYYNPSALYRYGVQISTELNKIREQISQIFGIKYESVFTSCGTESNNMVFNHFSNSSTAPNVPLYCPIFE